MSLRFKFTLYISVLLLLVIIGVSYNIYVTQKKFLTHQFSETRERTLTTFVAMCNEALKLRDELQVYNAIELLIKTYNPSVVYAGYTGTNNVNMYLSRDNNKNIDSEFKPRIKKVRTEYSEHYYSLSGEKIYEHSAPLKIGGENVGTFVVGFSQDYMEKQISAGISKMTTQIKLVAYVAIMIGVLFANFLGYTFAKPLKLLTEASEEITKGNLDVEIKLKRKDEIGVLFNTFNNMARQVKELDSMKDSFVSSVSHELRSPLSAIDGYCDLLIDGVKQGHPQEQQLKGLQIIKQATVRLTSFINNILDLAKIKANKLEIRKADTDIVAVISEIVSLYEPLAVQQKKKISLDIVFRTPIIIRADSEKIKQVITNLVSNAMKFTKENGNIILKVLENSIGYGEGYVEIWIKDDGIGIPKHQVDLVFEKFFQVQDGQFKRPKGTGLGLTIVAEMIKLHKGYVWAESDLGCGTTFKFVLPK
ncbi:hypothetical protein MASR1M68_13340 [Elusimicrobiota bacterium]